MSNLKDFISLPTEEKKREAEASMWKMVEDSVEHIAIARRSKEKYGISDEDFDKRLNEMCEAAYNRFNNMSDKDMMLHMINELLGDILGA